MRSFWKSVLLIFQVVLDNKVILIGYSGHAYVLADIAIENQYDIIGYTEKIRSQNNPFNLNYVGYEREIDFFENNKEIGFIIGIGNNLIREKTYNLIISKNKEVNTLISKTASISKSVKIGKGTFVNRNVSINALAIIGKNVILNTACVIEHECEISDSVHIAPGVVLAGNVCVGERSFIGANSVVKQGVKIGKDVIIGAGSVVISDVPDGKNVVGNPSRYI
jgi:sugar O-acyltransferase (sialic acid O-acetyltransferase NeuD family)